MSTSLVCGYIVRSSLLLQGVISSSIARPSCNRPLSTRIWTIRHDRNAIFLLTQIHYTSSDPRSALRPPTRTDSYAHQPPTSTNHKPNFFIPGSCAYIYAGASLRYVHTDVLWAAQQKHFWRVATPTICKCTWGCRFQK